MKQRIVVLLMLLLCCSFWACQQENVFQADSSSQDEIRGERTETEESDSDSPNETDAPSETESGCQHEYLLQATEATCTEPGQASYACSLCGDVYTEDIEALGHDFAEATCQAPKTCLRCETMEGGLGDHAWKAATCLAPKTCLTCQITEGKALTMGGAHTWSPATCTVPKTCRVCEETEGEPAEHRWKPALCNLPKHCSDCGVTDGEELSEHIWVRATCQSPKRCCNCGLTDGDELGDHEWRGGCNEIRVCAYCDFSDGEYGDHGWTEANCSYPKTCIYCEITEGLPNNRHAWSEANCLTPKYCGMCYTIEGQPIGNGKHQWVGGSCTVQQWCKICQAGYGSYCHEYNENSVCVRCDYVGYSEGLTYRLDGNEYTVTGIGSCKDTHIIIPETYKGKPVTAIGKKAFSHCEFIKEVTLPKTIKRIGSLAFADVQLDVLRIFDLVAWCQVKIEPSTKNEDELLNYGSEWIESFSLYVDGTSVPFLYIPKAVTTVEAETFYCCRGLKALVIHDGVTQIGDRAFAGCYHLRQVQMGSGVTEIGECAFDGCSSWQNDLVLPDRLERIGKGAFFGTSFSRVSFGNRLTAIPDLAFAWNDKLESVVIPDSVTAIGYRAFEDNNSLKQVVLGKNITKIGELAFAYGAMESVVIPKSVAQVGIMAFGGNSDLRDIYCEAAQKPAGWEEQWAEGSNATIHWNR